MTTPDPKTLRHWRGMTLRDQLKEWQERALEAEARVAELEAELAQSQAEVERWQLMSIARNGRLQTERALADELAKALRIHMNVYGVDWQGCNEFKRTDEELLARWKAIRSGAQGEEGDGAV